MSIALQDAPVPSCISVKTRQGIETIPLESIFYFIADHKYVTVVHTRGEHLIEQTLKELEATYTDWLLRCHRDTLINRRHLTGIERNTLGHYQIHLMNCQHKPHVSRRHLSCIKNWLHAQELAG